MQFTLTNEMQEPLMESNNEHRTLLMMKRGNKCQIDGPFTLNNVVTITYL